ncbi:hypothetical protein GOV12_05500 [Candidatus Pacearchaeota archaeon]|nr:hypothetical protein [Candidatus Pacearchaeota archaeon]
MAAETAAAGAAIGLFIFIGIIWFALFVVGILLLIFWIFMIIDVAKRNFKTESDKIIWILVVVLAGWIGAIIYYFVIKKPDKH